MTVREENITGASLGGSTGAADRTYTLANDDASSTGIRIYINGAYLTQGAGKDYTYSNQVLTFLNAVDDADLISLHYFTDEASVTATYCDADEVRVELDAKSSDDISDAIVNAAINRAESFIDLKTERSFKTNTIANEVYDTNPETMWASPERMLGMGNDANSRADLAFGGNLDTIQLKHKPIIAVSALSKNTAGTASADSWTALTEQSGSGGDFIIDSERGLVKFINDKPYYGKMRAFRVSYTWGLNRDATDRESVNLRLVAKEVCILLSVRTILTSKGSGSQFNSTDNISLESIGISKGIGQTTVYLGQIADRIKELFAELGVFTVNLGML